jgi:hypothetical protein
MKTQTAKLNHFYVVLAATFAAATLSACGGNAVQRTPDPGTTGGSFGGTNGGTTGSTGGTNGGITGGTTGGNNGGGFDPAASFSFEVTGGSRAENNYVTPTIYTDTKLRVRVNAGAAGAIRPINGNYSNYSAAYSCVSYKIEVQGRMFLTGYLNVPGSTADCGSGGATSQILDLSSFLTPGLGGFTIKVMAHQYDAYYQGCLWNPYLYGVNPYQYNWAESCRSMYFKHSVYQTHTVNGSIDVEVNGSML